MGETLKIASEKAGYTLADRATYLSMKDALDLVILREGDKELLNQYGVIVVTDAKNQAGGQAFADWILGAEGQKVIGEFGVEKYGQPLFIPNAPVALEDAAADSMEHLHRRAARGLGAARLGHARRVGDRRHVAAGLGDGDGDRAARRPPARAASSARSASSAATSRSSSSTPAWACRPCSSA